MTSEDKGWIFCRVSFFYSGKRQKTREENTSSFVKLCLIDQLCAPSPVDLSHAASSLWLFRSPRSVDVRRWLIDQYEEHPSLPKKLKIALLWSKANGVWEALERCFLVFLPSRGVGMGGENKRLARCPVDGFQVFCSPRRKERKWAIFLSTKSIPSTFWHFMVHQFARFFLSARRIIEGGM